MFVRSKIVPSAVHTGCSKGCNDTAQKLKGSRLKLAPAPEFADLRALAPALAPKASSLDHSEWVICSEVSEALEMVLRIETYVQLISSWYLSVSLL